jgi:ABC-type glycerol-3-phosphate transport system substrate-binding protein
MVAPARLAFLMLAAGAVLAACGAPTGQAETAQQKCAVCISENPGDGHPCYAICMQTDEGRVEYQQKYIGQ